MRTKISAGKLHRNKPQPTALITRYNRLLLLTCRRLPLRPGLSILRKRVEQLTVALVTAGQVVPAQDEEEKVRANRILESVGLKTLGVTDQDMYDQSSRPGDVESSAQILSPPDDSDPAGEIVQSNDHNLDQMSLMHNWSPPSMGKDVSPEWPWMDLFPLDLDTFTGSDWNLSGTTAQVDTLGVPEPQFNDHNPDDLTDQEMVNQIAARFGSLHLMHDGALRFFGTPATAHLSLSGKGLESTQRPGTISLGKDCLLHHAGLDLTVDRPFELHLLRLFFTWHNKCRALVHENDYYSARAEAHSYTKADENNSDKEALTNIM